MATWLQALMGRGERFTAAAKSIVTGNPGKPPGPETLSDAAEALAPQIALIDAVMDGIDCIKAGGQKFLPRFADETIENYSRRLADAPWRPIFPAAVEALVGKPFSRTVSLSGEPSERMKLFAEDVDAQGNNLHVYAKERFAEGVTHGLSAILVDHTRAIKRADGRALSRAEEKEQGLRPYWKEIPARNLIDIRTAMVKGREVVTHARWFTSEEIVDGFATKCASQIQMMDTDAAGGTYWVLFQQDDAGDFVEIDRGEITIGVIPLVLFRTGKARLGWGVKPPLYDLAHVALEYYRVSSKWTEVETHSAFPTLVISGATTAGEEAPDITVGPSKTIVLPARDSTAGSVDAKYIGPDSGLVSEVRKSPEAVLKHFEQLAMQPTVPRTGSVTATASALDAARAHSALESWALGLQDALDQALRFTALWLGEPDVTGCVVPTDFVSITASSDEGRLILQAVKDGVVSKKTARDEFKRRSILSADYDSDLDDEQIAKEQEGLEPEEPIDPRTGAIIPFERGAA